MLVMHWSSLVMPFAVETSARHFAIGLAAERRMMSRLLFVLMTSVLEVLMATPLAGQTTAFCNALTDAAGDDVGAYPAWISIGTDRIQCMFDKSKSIWSCTIKTVDRCDPP